MKVYLNPSFVWVLVLVNISGNDWKEKFE